MQRQVADRPEQALNSPAKRLIGLIGGLYLTPPIFAETGNYSLETQAAETAYLKMPWNNLLRSIPAGGLLLLLSGYGWAAGAGQAWRQRRQNQEGTRWLTLLLISSLLQGLALLALVPLPFQRYYLPLAAHACLWSAYGVETLRQSLVRRIPQRKAQPAA